MIKTTRTISELTGNYACVCLCQYSSLVLINSGTNEIFQVENAIRNNWPAGLVYKYGEENEGVRDNPKWHKFDFNGPPFQPGKEHYDTPWMRNMVTEILEKYGMLGWKLVMSTNLSRHFDQTTWVFRRADIDYYVKFVSISISGEDTFVLNNWPSEEISLIKETCKSDWLHGVKKGSQKSDGSYVVSTLNYMLCSREASRLIQLKGEPWHTTDQMESTSSCLLLKNLLTVLAVRNYMLTTNTDLRSMGDTMFFQQFQGLPVQKFFMIKLSGEDSLRMVNCPDNVVGVIVDTVEREWMDGVGRCFRSAKKYKHTELHFCEIRLNGKPWYCTGMESLKARYLLVKIFEALSAIRATLYTGLDLKRDGTDKANMIFNIDESDQVREYFCLAPCDVDKLHLINAPVEIQQAAQKIYNESALALLSDSHEQQWLHSARFEGEPWKSIKEGQGIRGRALMLQLLWTFTNMGWRFVCSMDATSPRIGSGMTSSSYVLGYCDAHSWYFTRYAAMPTSGLGQAMEPSAPASVLMEDELPPYFPISATAPVLVQREPPNYYMVPASAPLLNEDMPPSYNTADPAAPSLTEVSPPDYFAAVSNISYEQPPSYTEVMADKH